MRWFNFVALIVFSIPAAGAVAPGLAENPALCFGFISAQSPKETDALKRHKPRIRVLFGKSGPKDSTDERGFAEWERIGRDMASERSDKGYATFLADCWRLLGPNGN